MKYCMKVLIFSSIPLATGACEQAIEAERIMCVLQSSCDGLKSDKLTECLKAKQEAESDRCPGLADGELSSCLSNIRCLGPEGGNASQCKMGIFKRSYGISCAQGDVNCNACNNHFEELRNTLNDCNLPSGPDTCSAVVKEDPFKQGSFAFIKTAYVKCSKTICDDLEGDSKSVCEIPRNLLHQLQRNILAPKLTLEELKTRKSADGPDPISGVPADTAFLEPLDEADRAEARDVSKVFTPADLKDMKEIPKRLGCCDKISAIALFSYANGKCQSKRQRVEFEMVGPQKLNCKNAIIAEKCDGTHAASPSCRITQCYVECYSKDFGKSLVTENDYASRNPTERKTQQEQ